MVREIITEWTSPGDSPKLSVMYFDEAPTIASQRTALAAMWGTVDNSLATLCAWRIRTEGRVLDTATGALTGFWNEGTAQAGAGTSPTTTVADATQLLIQWLTNTIVDGRRLRGRTFVPGLPTSAVTAGNLASGIQTAVDAAADTFVASGAGFQIWHRPTPGAGGAPPSGGSAAAVTGASVWNELAVLRKRRG